MQTIERPVAPVERLARNNRFLIIALVVAVLAAAGLGAWLIVDNAQTAVEREITALINSYYQAWEANDGQAVKELMTEDARLLPVDGGSHSRSQIAMLVEGPGGSVYRPTLVDGPLILEPSNAAGWMAASVTLVPDYREASVGQPDVAYHGDWRQMELFHIVEQDGRYLINYHEMWRAGE